VASDTFFGQHRGQSSHHSAADGADNVIKGGSMFFLWFNSIKVFDPAVNSVKHRLVKPFNDSLSRRAGLPGDRYS
jgi:hypothetical protein